jgi:RNA polymerase sigma-70 factor (ECF subfamily)
MDTSSTSQTSITLLDRLRQTPTDQAAWNDFVGRYGPQIYRWCRHWHLQEADAQDVTQTVLLKLAQKMGSFAYQPGGSFRGWLKTLTRHAWSDFVAGRQRPGRGSGGREVDEMLASLDAGDDLVQRVDEEFQREVLEQATVRVRLRVAPRTWDAFRLTALEGQPAVQVAAQLGMKVAHVYVAKSEVLKMLQEEVQKLEGGS